MMKKRKICAAIIIAFIFTYGCKKAYNPPVANTYDNILVVEGIINTGGIDSIIIKVSRTGKVYNPALNAEANATVTVENEQQTVLTLTEAENGTYTSPPAALDNTKQYRLRIKTSNGKTYLSDFVDAKLSPPIDSIGYLIQGTGIQIYINTHDPNNNTHYYKYTYSEAWEFNAYYYAKYIFSYQDTLLHIRTASQEVYYCYNSDTSSQTIINSTAQLNQDAGLHVPIINIDSTSEKIENKYSILVTQQALSKDAYAFYESLQKNTTQLGSIFDAQPSQLIGNIHNAADATEPVVGFITAGTTTQKRVFISKGALLAKFHTLYPYTYGCKIDTAVYYPGEKHDSLRPVPLYLRKDSYYVQETLYPNAYQQLYVGEPLGLALDSLADGNGFTFSSPICTDCTLRGKITPPIFWK
jgi:hypothetical protein